MRFSKELHESGIVTGVILFGLGLMIPAAAIMLSTSIVLIAVLAPLIGLLLFGDVIAGLLVSSFLGRVLGKKDVAKEQEAQADRPLLRVMFPALCFFAGVAASTVGLF